MRLYLAYLIFAAYDLAKFHLIESTFLNKYFNILAYVEYLDRLFVTLPFGFTSSFLACAKNLLILKRVFLILIQSLFFSPLPAGLTGLLGLI